MEENKKIYKYEDSDSYHFHSIYYHEEMNKCPFCQSNIGDKIKENLRKTIVQDDIVTLKEFADCEKCGIIEWQTCLYEGSVSLSFKKHLVDEEELIEN